MCCSLLTSKPKLRTIIYTCQTESYDQSKVLNNRVLVSLLCPNYLIIKFIFVGPFMKWYIITRNKNIVACHIGPKFLGNYRKMNYFICK